MDTTLIGIDISKNVFQIQGVDNRGKSTLKAKLSRSKLLSFMVHQKRCLVVMESCGGAHHWGREFQKLGYEVKLIAPQFVKPFVKSQKNDANDALGICEAASRASMRYVGVKTVQQQEIQSTHRIRERLIKSRTALSNEIRGLLHEYGVTIPKGISNIRGRLGMVLEKHKESLTENVMALILELAEEFKQIDERVKEYDKKIVKIHESHPVSKRLVSIPGVGPVVATAVIGAVADPHVFKNGREFSAWLGLVPRQDSSGGKTKLGGITKRGNKYIRKLLVHGARSAVIHSNKYTDKRSLWTQEIHKRRGMNRASVANANKNARYIWVLLTNDNAVYEKKMAA